MSKVKAIHIKDVEGIYREPARTSWILVSEKTVGSKNIAMGINETNVGSCVPEHKHEKEEVILCREGKLVAATKIPIEPVYAFITL